MNAPPIQPNVNRSLGIITFVSALALFFIQPVVGEILTPAWGGTPTVWLACLLFFQTVLFIGYFLAWVGNTLYPRASFTFYCLTLLFGLLLLILTPPPTEPESFWIDWLPTNMGVVGYLGAHLLLIALGLSTTSTLAHHVLGNLNTGKITQLYAYSNAGSFLALLSFPLVIEPTTTRLQQIQIFTFLVLLQTIISFTFLLSNQKLLQTIRSTSNRLNGIFVFNKETKWWILIPICTSSLLCGVTSHISTEIASVPFLWILPLALYLLSYVISFGNCPKLLIFLLNRYAPILSTLLFFILSLSGLELSSGTIIVPLFIHFGCFFIVCIILHHILHEKRPQNQSPNSPSLGFYYCMMSLGGLLGTLLQCLVFPVAFSHLGLWEYPLAIAGGIFLVGCHSTTQRPTLAQWALPVSIPLLVLTIRIVLGPLDNTIHPTLASTITGGLFFVCLACAKDGRVLGTSLILGFVSLTLLLFAPEDETEIRRNTFGVLKVIKRTKNEDKQTLLYHGNTIHGIQSEALKDGQGRLIPLSYYGLDGPAGDAFTKLQRIHTQKMNVGIIGLGVGSMAWYGRPQDQIDFFELDPAVGEIAENPKQFQFINQCASAYKIHFGDGRRMVNTHSSKFNLLVLDAFSSDTVPIHLLTQEALEVYWSHLEQNGTLLCHVSNRHFDLLRLMKGWEKVSGKTGYLFDNRDLAPGRIAQGFSPSQWVIFTKDNNLLTALERDIRWQGLAPGLDSVTWTDDHHSILSLLKW